MVLIKKRLITDASRPIYWWCRTCNITFVIFKVFYACNLLENKNFKLKEPFKGLFTQGMVCHETYKDQKGNCHPDEIINIEGKKYLKKDKNQIIKVNHLSHVQI